MSTQVLQKKPAGIRLRCNRCKRVWLYRGKSEWFACCSQCRFPVHVRNDRIGENVPLGNARDIVGGSQLGHEYTKE